LKQEGMKQTGVRQGWMSINFFDPTLGMLFPLYLKHCAVLSGNFFSEY